ncbi:MAG TPA: NAD(P) transhydrogenase subunit alpha [Phycisphaerae bacterium]|nr:NAD(P) transhydrogenase subunit alpha [Phycisphaerae bacterium]
MIVGVPKEILSGERRVAATPATVKKMVAGGMNVLVEAGAGLGSYVGDDDYRQAGAEVLADVESLFGRSEIILKVKQPLHNDRLGKHEVQMMRNGQVLVTFLHPASPTNHDTVRQLAEQGVTALTLDCVPRITLAQSMDALTSMSTVAGYKAVIMAADRLLKFVPMVSTAAGVVQPSTALIVGAGVAGLQALATAKRLGAVTYAADIRQDACEQARSLGAKIVELGIPEEVAVGAGGYAKQLPGEWLARERDALGEQVAKSDILILTALVPGRRAPVLVTEGMVKAMQAGSAIVDVAIDQGGNCEISESGQVVTKWGVTIDGTPNIPGTMPLSATHLFAENVLSYLSRLAKDGKLHLDPNDEIIGPCLVTHDGRVVHRGALEAMGQAGPAGTTPDD